MRIARLPRSVIEYSTFGGHSGYLGSKNFLNVLNKSIANEIRPEGIISLINLFLSMDRIFFQVRKVLG
jgi:hypothetical protein